MTIITNAVQSILGMALYHPIVKAMEELTVECFEYVHTAWLISPSGRLIAEFPFTNAFRIYRKRREQGWNISTIKPQIPYWKRIFKIVKILPFKQPNIGYINTILGIAPMITYMAAIAGAIKSKEQ